MKEHKIFVDTSHGRVLHGTLTGTVFQRRLNSNGIRVTDQTLPLNPQCVSQLWALGCETLEYTVDYSGSTVKYTILFMEWFTLLNGQLRSVLPLITNEYGDRDYRIPIDSFKQELITMKPMVKHREDGKIPNNTFMQEMIFGDAYTADKWKTEKRTQKRREDRSPF